MDREKNANSYKKIYDPVHGFIKLSGPERDLVDSYAFQRLHYIRQLGVAYLVYPGALHTRFEHSLGTMELASRIFDRITEHFSDRPDSDTLAYWRQVVRFGALCHDLGHLPFSHVAEKKILGDEGHEVWTIALIESSFLSPLWDRFSKDFPGRPVVDDIIKVAIGEAKLKNLPGRPAAFTPWERVMSQIITGDFFGADRIDYLLRDAGCTGVSYGLFDYHQLIEMLRILPCPETKGLTLGVEENGIESCQALLLARHFMHKRVYHYPSVRAYSFHMAAFMSKLYEREMPLLSLGKYLSYTDNEVLCALKTAFLDPSLPGHEDALPLFVRENRYLAIELPSDLKEEDVIDWQDRLKIGREKAESFFMTSKAKTAPTFFVRQGDEILDAKDCSDLTIPSLSHNWLYLSPQYEGSLQKLLGKI